MSCRGESSVTLRTWTFISAEASVASGFCTAEPGLIFTPLGWAAESALWDVDESRAWMLLLEWL